MGERFLLQLTLPRLVGKIIGQRAVDFARMRVMPLDEVRIIAVHGPDKVADRILQDWMNPSA